MTAMSDKRFHSLIDTGAPKLYIQGSILPARRENDSTVFLEHEGGEAVWKIML